MHLPCVCSYLTADEIEAGLRQYGTSPDHVQQIIKAIDTNQVSEGAHISSPGFAVRGQNQGLLLFEFRVSGLGFMF